MRGRVFGQDGSYLGEVDSPTFGMSAWEILHPGQVQQEYEAQGKVAPSQAEIVSTAIDDAVNASVAAEKALGESASTFASASATLIKFIVVGIVALAIIRIAPARSRQTFNRYRTKLRRQAAKYVRR